MTDKSAKSAILARSTETIEHDGNSHTGEYHLANGMIHVSVDIDGEAHTKATQIGGTSTVALARMMIREIVQKHRTGI